MVIAFISDHAQHRFFFSVAPMAISITGFVMLLTVKNHNNVLYGALFMAACGTYSAMPVIVCWFSTNSEYN